MVMDVLLNELMARLAYVELPTRNVTLHPETKFKPLIVNGCALLEPVTGFGVTLLIEGAAIAEGR